MMDAKSKPPPTPLPALAKWAAIEESSEDAFLGLSSEGSILSWSAAAERLFGHPAAEILTKPFTALFPIERQDELAQVDARLRRGERIERFETLALHNDHSIIEVSVACAPVRDENGTLVGNCAVFTDITRFKEAEKALRESDRRKDEFLAMLAHELRNPLAPIRNALYVLKLPGVDSETLTGVRNMAERQVQYMARLLDDLLDVSRLSRGRIELRKEFFDVATIVNRTLETMRPFVVEREQELNVGLPSPPLTIEADPTRLEQILTNLLNNAAKYTDTGGHLWLSVNRQGSWAVFKIRDTGVGIEADMLPRIFDLFVQAERRLDRSQGGVGIGLTLVKLLVELHGGQVEAHSAGAGQGSEFVVRLPAQEFSEDNETKEEEMPVRIPDASRRVLVVDDNRDAADSLALLLKLVMQDVRVAYDGHSALETARTYQPDLVFLDIGMPGMDGYEVAKVLRREVGPRVLLIALTGWGQDEDRERTRQAGFDHHVVKPVEPSALQKILAELKPHAG
jgi:PAS domain S-box-containing protein